MDVVLAVGLKGQALFARHVVHALADQHFGLGVQFQGYAQGARRAVAGMVVGCGANTAERKHHIAARARGCKGSGQRGGDALRVIAHVIRVTQLQSAGGQQLNGFGHVLVGTLAGEDFIADDDDSEMWGHEN